MDYIQHNGRWVWTAGARHDRISPRDTVQQSDDVGAAAISVWVWSETLTGTVCVSVSFELIPALLPAATLLQWPLGVLWLKASPVAQMGCSP